MPRRAIKDCPLLFFDCETGGLDPAANDMLEVACILTDPTGKDIREEYSQKVIPLKPVHPQAAAVNGYSVEKWASEGAVQLDGPLRKMLLMASDQAIFVAHNTPFDWAFFSKALAVRLMKWPGDYHKIDTCALAWPLLVAGKVPNVKLATLASYFQITHNDAHTALADVRACRELYLKLVAAYGPVMEAL